MDNMIVITNHAKIRMKERTNIKSEGRMLRTAQAAYQNGQGIEELTGNMLRYLESRIKDDRLVKLYHDQIYVFWEKILITVLPMDRKFQRNMEKNRCKARKKQERR